MRDRLLPMLQRCADGCLCMRRPRPLSRTCCSGGIQNTLPGRTTGDRTAAARAQASSGKNPNGVGNQGSMRGDSATRAAVPLSCTFPCSARHISLSVARYTGASNRPHAPCPASETGVLRGPLLLAAAGQWNGSIAWALYGRGSVPWCAPLSDEDCKRSDCACGSEEH